MKTLFNCSILLSMSYVNWSRFGTSPPGYALPEASGGFLTPDFLIAAAAQKVETPYWEASPVTGAVGRD